MGGGNGAKAQQKRERNAKKAPSKKAGAATPMEMLICKSCYWSTMATGKASAEAHLKTCQPNKTFDDCFKKGAK